MCDSSLALPQNRNANAEFAEGTEEKRELTRRLPKRRKGFSVQPPTSSL